MLTESGVRARVTKDLQQSGMPLNPVLVLTITSAGQACILEKEDVMRVFSVYGEICSVQVKNTEAFIVFEDLVSAYFAQKTLDGRLLQNSNLTLHVLWREEAPEPQTWDESFDLYGDNSSKFTCRFDVQIPNERDFQVARRLIGLKGCNMKRIVEICSQGLQCPLTIPSNSDLELSLIHI